MDKKQVSSLLKKIYGTYPSFDLIPERVQMWGKLMSELDYALAIKRFERYAATNTFPPTPAHILNPEEATKKKKWGEPDTVSPATVLQGGYRLM